MSNDHQKKLGQHKKDRVYIAYKEREGDTELHELPFVVGVMANLSGHKSRDDRGALEEREFIRVPGGNLDPLMEELRPTLNLEINNKLSDKPPEVAGKLIANLKFSALSDFEPLRVAAMVPELKEFLDLRQKLTNLRAYLDGKPGAQKFVWAELQRMVKESQQGKDKTVESEE